MTIGRSTLIAAVLLVGACDTPCAFRIVTRLELGAGRVACCGAGDVQDVVLPDQPDLAVGIAQPALPERVGGQDVWLTSPDCEQLFDGPYAEPGTGPRATPKCDVLLGPVIGGPRESADDAAAGALPAVRAGVLHQRHLEPLSRRDQRVGLCVRGLARSTVTRPVLGCAAHPLSGGRQWDGRGSGV